jgi:hypothetical protein
MGYNIIGILDRIWDVFKKFRRSSVSPGDGSAAPNNNGPGKSGVEVNETIVGGKVTVNITNVNYNMNCNDVKEAAQQFSQKTENVIVAKDDANGFSLFVHQDPNHLEFLAVGFFASCSCEDKKGIPIWAGFQPQEEPFKDNTLENLTFSIELLGREKWGGESSKKRAIIEKLGYKGKGEDGKREAVYYKFFNGMTLKTNAQELYDCFCAEVEKLGELLG